MLGIVGSFLFILSANYGQMDSLVDDGDASLRPTRLKALAVPAVMLAVYVLFCCSGSAVGLRLAVGMIAAFIIPTAYYNFKHIIIFDVEEGIIQGLRTYNILALAYGFLVLLEYVFGYLGHRWLYAAACIGVGAVTVAMMPALKRGLEEWTAAT